MTATPSGYRRLSRTFVLESEDDRRAVIGQVRALAVPVRPRWRITIEPDESPRTPKQNKRQWSLFRYIAANAWVDGKRFSPEAWHSHYCGALIGWEEGPNGERIAIGTSTLTTREHNDFIDRVMAAAASEFDVDFTHWDERTA